MRRLWLLMGGILLIALLTLLCFASKRDAIVDDILTKTKTLLSDKNISVTIHGSGYKTTRSVVLQGHVASADERASIEKSVKEVQGVDDVINLITIQPRVNQTTTTQSLPSQSVPQNSHTTLLAQQQKVLHSHTAPPQANSNAQQSVDCKKMMQTLQASAIYFDTNKATIDAAGKALLHQTIIFLKACPHVTLTIEGYTDTQGKRAYNQKLSQQRADSIKNYLIHSGIAPERIKTIGYGETKPIASNMTEVGRSQNRRIILRFEGVAQ